MRRVDFAAALGADKLDEYLSSMEVYSGVMIEDAYEVFPEDVDCIIDGIDRFVGALIDAHDDAHGSQCDCGTHERLQLIVNLLDHVDAMKSAGDSPARVADELYIIIREFRFMNLRASM